MIRKVLKKAIDWYLIEVKGGKFFYPILDRKRKSDSNGEKHS